MFTLNPEPWTVDAACAQVDPDVFFPEQDENAYDAKRICRSCDAVAACLAYALENDERYGIWGNTSPRQRERMRRQSA